MLDSYLCQDFDQGGRRCWASWAGYAECRIACVGWMNPLLCNIHCSHKLVYGFWVAIFALNVLPVRASKSGTCNGTRLYVVCRVLWIAMRRWEENERVAESRECEDSEDGSDGGALPLYGYPYVFTCLHIDSGIGEDGMWGWWCTPAFPPGFRPHSPSGFPSTVGHAPSIPSSSIPHYSTPISIPHAHRCKNKRRFLHLLCAGSYIQNDARQSHTHIKRVIGISDRHQLAATFFFAWLQPHMFFLEGTGLCHLPGPSFCPSASHSQLLPYPPPTTVQLHCHHSTPSRQK